MYGRSVGCIPGEAVYVNGIVIGRATEDVVVLRSREGMVEPCSGLEPKPHGLEKLPWTRTSISAPRGARAGQSGQHHHKGTGRHLAAGAFS